MNVDEPASLCSAAKKQESADDTLVVSRLLAIRFRTTRHAEDLPTCSVPPRVGSLIRLRIEPILRPSLHPCRQCTSIRDGSCQLSTSGQEHRYCSSSSEERFRGRVHAASVAVCKVRHIRHSLTEQTCRSMQPNLFRAHDHIAGFEAWRPPPSYAITSATGRPITCPNLATTRFRARKLPPLDQI